MVDLQNASLSGGVAVGAVANLMLQPYGALLLGLAAGAVSTLGYRRLSPRLLSSRLRLEDTCGVHNLHGMPAVLSAVVSAGMCAAATEEQYGDRFCFGTLIQYSFVAFCNFAIHRILYCLSSFALVFPLLTPGGRGHSGQAAWQVAGITITVAVATLAGLIVGQSVGFVAHCTVQPVW